MTWGRALALLFVLSPLGGCSMAHIVGTDAGTDAGAADSGMDADAPPVDLGTDAGPPPIDLGTPDTGPPPSYHVVGDAGALYLRGGTGGGPYELDCMPGQLVVGLQYVFDDPDAGLGYSVPHAMRIVCATLLADGSLGSDRVSPPAGTAASVTYPVDVADHCPPGSAVAGLVGATADYCSGCGTGVMLLGVTCAPIPAWVVDRTGAMSLGAHGLYPGSTPFDDVCDPSTFVTTVQGNAGAGMDAVQAVCSSVVAM